jgi:hypothetical protein
MGVLSAVSVSEIKARGSIKDADVLKLRRSYYDDGHITAEEAEAIIRPQRCLPGAGPAWADCFVETITDYIVDQAQPEGYLTAANAAWLIERVAKDGRIETKTELELLVNVLDKARWAPQSLVTFTLKQVKEAVIAGSGVLRNGKQLGAGVVTEGDVDMLRRILYAYGGDGSIGVTQPEGRGAVRHQRRHRGRRQPPLLARPVRQSHRQLRDVGLGLCRSGPRDRARP